MNYTLSAAAKAAGVAKSTLSKAIKNKELSIAGKTGNSFRIAPAELDRWMDVHGKRSPNDKIEHSRTPEKTVTLEAENAVLQKEIEMLREMMEKMEKQSEGWQRQAEINTRLLEDHSKPRGFIERVFGKAS